MNDFNKKIIEEFRANGGKVGGHFENMDLLILHTTGANSGNTHLTPLVYTIDGDRYVIIASKGGAPTHPDWYYNLVANPHVVVEVGVEQFKAAAAIAEEPERSKLYGTMADRYPFFTEYQENTQRVIPVVTLTRKI